MFFKRQDLDLAMGLTMTIMLVMFTLYQALIYAIFEPLVIEQPV